MGTGWCELVLYCSGEPEILLYAVLLSSSPGWLTGQRAGLPPPQGQRLGPGLRVRWLRMRQHPASYEHLRMQSQRPFQRSSGMG